MPAASVTPVPKETGSSSRTKPCGRCPAGGVGGVRTALGAAGDDELVEVPASVDASALLELLLDELLLDELPEVSGASVVVVGAVVVGAPVVVGAVVTGGAVQSAGAGPAPEGSGSWMPSCG